MAKVGRPENYSPEMLKKAKGYLATCIDKPAQGLNGKIKVSLPCMAGFCLYLDISKSAAQDYAAKYPEFRTILDKINIEQERRLLENGMSGNYNSTIAKLVLTKHGYSDKQETDVTSGGQPIQVHMVDWKSVQATDLE